MPDRMEWRRKLSETLERVLEEVKGLSPEERWQLRDQIDLYLSNWRASSALEELLLALYDQGAIKEITPKPVDLKQFREFRPQKLEGKPVSETLLEERR
jgi:hypothetical protein